MSRDPLEEREYANSLARGESWDEYRKRASKIQFFSVAAPEEVISTTTAIRNRNDAGTAEGILYIRNPLMQITRLPETFHEGDEVEIIARLKRKP